MSESSLLNQTMTMPNLRKLFVSVTVVLVSTASCCSGASFLELQPLDFGKTPARGFDLGETEGEVDFGKTEADSRVKFDLGKTPARGFDLGETEGEVDFGKTEVDSRVKFDLGKTEVDSDSRVKFDFGVTDSEPEVGFDFSKTPAPLKASPTITEEEVQDPRKKLRVVFLRHGEGEHNVSHNFKILDPELTAIGKFQAAGWSKPGPIGSSSKFGDGSTSKFRDGATYLETTFPNVKKIYSSPLLRCVQTAILALQNHDIELEVNDHDGISDTSELLFNGNVVRFEMNKGAAELGWTFKNEPCNKAGDEDKFSEGIMGSLFKEDSEPAAVTLNPKMKEYLNNKLNSSDFCQQQTELRSEQQKWETEFSHMKYVDNIGYWVAPNNFAFGTPTENNKTENHLKFHFWEKLYNDILLYGSNTVDEDSESGNLNEILVFTHQSFIYNLPGYPQGQAIKNADAVVFEVTAEKPNLNQVDLKSTFNLEAPRGLPDFLQFRLVSSESDYYYVNPYTKSQLPEIHLTTKYLEFHDEDVNGLNPLINGNKSISNNALFILDPNKEKELFDFEAQDTPLKKYIMMLEKDKRTGGQSRVYWLTQEIDWDFFPAGFRRRNCSKRDYINSSLTDVKKGMNRNFHIAAIYNLNDWLFLKGLKQMALEPNSSAYRNYPVHIQEYIKNSYRARHQDEPLSQLLRLANNNEINVWTAVNIPDYLPSENIDFETLEKERLARLEREEKERKTTRLARLGLTGPTPLPPSYGAYGGPSMNPCDNPEVSELKVFHMSDTHGVEMFEDKIYAEKSLDPTKEPKPLGGPGNLYELNGISKYDYIRHFESEKNVCKMVVHSGDVVFDQTHGGKHDWFGVAGPTNFQLDSSDVNDRYASYNQAQRFGAWFQYDVLHPGGFNKGYLILGNHDVNAVLAVWLGYKDAATSRTNERNLMSGFLQAIQDGISPTSYDDIESDDGPLNLNSKVREIAETLRKSQSELYNNGYRFWSQYSKDARELMADDIMDFYERVYVPTHSDGSLGSNHNDLRKKRETDVIGFVAHVYRRAFLKGVQTRNNGDETTQLSFEVISDKTIELNVLHQARGGGDYNKFRMHFSSYQPWGERSGEGLNGEDNEFTYKHQSFSHAYAYAGYLRAILGPVSPWSEHTKLNLAHSNNRAGLDRFDQSHIGDVNILVSHAPPAFEPTPYIEVPWMKERYPDSTGIRNGMMQQAHGHACRTCMEYSKTTRYKFQQTTSSNENIPENWTTEPNSELLKEGVHLFGHIHKASPGEGHLARTARIEGMNGQFYSNAAAPTQAFLLEHINWWDKGAQENNPLTNDGANHSLKNTIFPGVWMKAEVHIDDHSINSKVEWAVMNPIDWRFDTKNIGDGKWFFSKDVETLARDGWRNARNPNNVLGPTANFGNPMSDIGMIPFTKPRSALMEIYDEHNNIKTFNLSTLQQPRYHPQFPFKEDFDPNRSDGGFCPIHPDTHRPECDIFGSSGYKVTKHYVDFQNVGERQWWGLYWATNPAELKINNILQLVGNYGKVCETRFSPQNDEYLAYMGGIYRFHPFATMIHHQKGLMSCVIEGF